MPKTASSLVVMSISALVLGGCAVGPRDGPPAPVERVTPLTNHQGTSGTQTTASKSKPAASAPRQQGTRTYAYREPGTEPASEPAAVAPAQPGPAATAAQGAPAASAPAPVAKAADATVSTPTEPPAQTRPPAPVTKVSPPAPPQPAAPPPQPKAEQQVAAAGAPVAAPAEPPPPAAPAPSAPVSGLPPAADSLARQAEQQRQMGDYAGAAATLERALRIAPRESYLWNRLARVRMEQGLSAQAGQLASRSNDLSASPSLRKDNWRIIAESKRRAGDVVGAGEAEKRAGGG